MNANETNKTETTETSERIEYRGFSYALEHGRYRVYDTAGEPIDYTLRNEATAKACIDTIVKRAELQAREAAIKAAARAQEMEQNATLTPAARVRRMLDRRENNADDLI